MERTASTPIEGWAQSIVTTALGDGSAIINGASQDPRPGTASLRVVQTIFAPRTTQAASAARKALDDIIKGFAKDCGLHSFITMALHPANKPASRHIDMRIHFCRQHVELGDVATTFAPTPDMVADFMTKQTQRLTHERHCRRAFGNQHRPLPLEPIVRVLA
jgi:hypothetical protein